MLRFALLSALLATGLWACTPASPYRYSGMVPAARPLPFDGRTAEKGSLRLEGTVTRTVVVENDSPRLHDTALWVPNTTLDGSASVAISNEVELGGRLSYSSYQWSDHSALGTAPLPGSPSMLGIGPEVRASIPLDRAKKVHLGIAANYIRYDLPIAQWSRVQSCAPGDTCFRDESTTSLNGTTYKLTGQSKQSQWVYSAGLYPTYSFGDHGEYGHIVGMLGIHQGFKNDGFTDTSATDGAITSNGPVLMIGCGYGITLDRFHLAAMGYHPLTDSSSPVNYLWGGMVSLGVDLDVFGRKGD